jgi:Putative zinc-finger
MRALHGRWRRRVSLLAAGALSGPESDTTLRHLEGCQACREDAAAIRALLDAVPTDAVRGATPGVTLDFLVARVRARLDSRSGGPSRSWRWAWAAPLLAVGAALAVVLLVRPGPTGPAGAASTPRATVDPETLRRLERNVTREQAVRFLNDAQDVLVTMAATQRDCDHSGGSVDVGDEAQRSRELLTRRAMLMDLDDEDVASARPVLEDVEHVLRQVASLHSCARAGDVERVRRDVQRRRLLMKVRLMSRELQG